MNINSIVWPSSKKLAVSHYLNFLIKVLDLEGIKFPDKFEDPIGVTKGYLSGKVSTDELREEANKWWSYIDSTNKIRDFSSQNALIARMAICLLSVTEEDYEELGEHLSWFFEVLGNYGIGLSKPLELMSEHFEFK